LNNTLVFYSGFYGATPPTAAQKNAIDMSFLKSITGKILSTIDTVFTDSIDSKTTTAEQTSFESSTKKSTIIVNGGDPSSFSIQVPNSFNSWSQTIDLFPVPATSKSQFSLISNIIPKEWTFTRESQDFSIQNLWKQAESRVLFDSFKTGYFFPGMEMQYYGTPFYILGAENCRIHTVDNINGNPVKSIIATFYVVFIDIDNSDILNFIVGQSFLNCKMELINLLTFRSHPFLVSNNMAVIRTSKPNSIRITLIPESTNGLGVTCSGTIYGTLGTINIPRTIVLVSTPAPQEIIFDSDYLGTIVSISFNFESQYPGITFTYKFNTIVVSHTCSSSACIPDKTPLPSVGYSVAYQSRRPTQTFFSTMTYSEIYFDLVPFGTNPPSS